MFGFPYFSRKCKHLTLMSQGNTYNDDLLFRQIAEGSENAFTEVFKRYTPRLFSYMVRIVKDEQLAKEFVQETFLRLWVHRDQLREIRLPGSWLFRIAANLSIEHLRKEAIRNNLQDKVYARMKPGEFGVTEVVEERELAGIIRRAVDSLPDKRKEVYLLSREAGLSHQEIADQLGIAVTTVKTHIGLALQAIREQLHNQTGLSIAVLALLLSN